MEDVMKVGDTVYKARLESYSAGPMVTIQSAKIKQVRKNGLILDQRELAWGCRCFVSSDEVFASERKAVAGLLAGAHQNLQAMQDRMTVKLTEIAVINAKLKEMPGDA
jgi:DNA-binding IclR family transcriptional regulator